MNINFFKKAHLLSLALILTTQYSNISSWSVMSSNAQNTSEPATTLPSSHLDTCLKKVNEKTFKVVLENGFTGILYQTQPESSTPEVVTMLCFDVGSADEEHGQFGFAHAVEHMIFKGTDKMSELDLKAIAEKFCIGSIGIGYNASTGRDITRYYFKTDKHNWPYFAEILADCMQNVKFDEQAFTSEVKAIVNELKIYSKTPERLIYNILSEELYPVNHPYHHPLPGFKEDLLRAKASEVKAFYKQHYTPEKGLLLVIGDVEKDHFENLLKMNFSQVPPRNDHSKKHAYLNIPEQQLAQKKIVVRKHIPAQIVSFIWKTLDDHNNRTDVVTQDCLDFILQERLRPLKDDHELVLTIYTGGDTNKFGGMFTISLKPKKELDRSFFDRLFNGERIITRCKKFILEQLEALATNGPTDQELARFKRCSKSSLLSLLENPTGIASILSQGFFVEKNEFQLSKDIDHIEKLTTASVKAFCQKYLNLSKMHTVIFKPIKQEEEKEWLELQSKIDATDAKLMDERIRETMVQEERLVHDLPEPKLIDFTFEQPDYSFILSNGLQVFVKQKSGTPFVSLSCGFKNDEKLSLYFDSKNQDPLKTLTMSLLMEGSNGFSKQEHIDFFHERGASCSFYGSGGLCTSLLEDFDTVVKRFAHILIQPTFPRSAYKRVIANRIEEIKQLQQQETHIARKTAGDYLFSQYPWRKTDQQEIELLEGVWNHDIVKFHREHVTPSNMFLVVVGDVDLNTLKATLNTSLASWKAKEQTKLFDFVVPEIQNPLAKTLIKEMPKEMVILTMARITDYAETDDALALELLQQYVTKQLFAIRENTGLFYAFNLSLTSSGFLTKGAAQIITMLTPQNVVAVEKLFKETLHTVAEHGIPEHELNIAQQTQRMTLAKSFSTNDDLCSAYSFLIKNNKDWNYLEETLARINKLSLQDVNAVAKRYFDPSTWSVVKVGRLDNNDSENLSDNK